MERIEGMTVADQKRFLNKVGETDGEERQGRGGRKNGEDRRYREGEREGGSLLGAQVT